MKIIKSDDGVIYVNMDNVSFIHVYYNINEIEIRTVDGGNIRININKTSKYCIKNVDYVMEIIEKRFKH